VALLIGFTVIGAAIGAVVGLLHYQMKLSLVAKQSDVTIKTFQAAQGVINAMDSQSLPLLPIISSDPAKLFTALRGARIPKLGSDSISAIALDLRLAIRILRIDDSIYRGCYVQPSSLLRPQIRSLIALSPDGIFELSTVRPVTLSNKPCFNLKVDLIPNSYWETTTMESKPYAEILIPVIQEFTIYLDQSNQLRYLAHVGREIIENQPLVGLVENLRFSLSFQEDLPILDISVTPLFGKAHRRILYGSTTHRGSWGTMFNLYSGGIK